MTKHEHASNTSHPSRLPTLQTRVISLIMVSASSDVQMQLPAEISASNFHLTVRENSY